LKGVGESCVFRTKPAPEGGAEPVGLTAGKLEEVA
jgi:hypothetical protein